MAFPPSVTWYTRVPSPIHTSVRPGGQDGRDSRPRTVVTRRPESCVPTSRLASLGGPDVPAASRLRPRAGRVAMATEVSAS